MVQSVIAAGLRIVGDIKSRSDILVEGRVEGNLQARGLTIAEGARVDGSVMARTAQIHGTLTGDIGAGTVVIGKTAEISGAVLYHSLSVEPGARLEVHFQNLKGRAPISDTASPGSAAAAADSADPVQKKDGA
jgi:cytoskeletal protein CcmA (bactofilin family)